MTQATKGMLDYGRRKGLGLCTRSGCDAQPVAGSLLCDRHRGKARRSMRSSAQRSRQRSRADGLCTQRGSPSKTYRCSACNTSRRFSEVRDALVASQGGRCAICAEPFSKGKRRPCVDHCHETGRVRGALCASCNTALGMFNDEPATLRAAAAYLEVEPTP